MVKRSIAGKLIVLGVMSFKIFVSTVSAVERTKITIYTALEPEQITWVDEALSRAVPEAELVWVRGSTGAIITRLQFEADHPQADIAFGIAASNLILLKKAGLLAEYRPAAVEQLRSFFLDPTPPYTWTGMDAYLGVVCFNREIAARSGARQPILWNDFLSPAYIGQVTMPDPNLSGTGFLLVAGWLQTMGEAAAWKFMDALHKNIIAYLQTGSAPCFGAARGEYAAGISFDMRAVTEKAKGSPIEIIVPVDGVGWEAEAFAIIKSTQNLRLAKKIIDWASSREANEIYARSFAIVAHPDVINPASDYPPYAEARMMIVDLGWEADHRESILQEWNRRYRRTISPK